MKFSYFNYKTNSHKKLLLVVVFLLLAIVSTFATSFFIDASSTDSNANEERLSDVVSNIISDINFGDLDNMISELDTLDLFNGTIKDKVTSIVKGEYFTNYSSIISGILSLFIIDLKKFLPFLFTIIAIGILSSLIKEFKTSSDNSDNVIHFVCMSVMVITIIFVFKDVLEITSSTMSTLLSQMDIIFPILLALMSAIGSLVSISIYNPLVAVLTTIVGIAFNKILYPIFIVIFIFTILGSLTDTVKLDKFQGFLSSSFKWIVGIIFTIFTGFLSIQGITAGRYDNVSIKATKFAIKSYIPIIGSYISDGMEFIILGSVLVKNTVGLVGILIIFLTVVSPIISILIIKLGFQLSGAVLEMCGSKKLADFITKCSKILIMPIVIILGVAFMYLITVALIMCTSNIF